MSYPSSPWQLQGYGMQALHLLDIERVRPLIPPGLTIVPVFPGKTLGGVYVSAYELGSVLTYNELIVVGATVAHGGKVGAWITHIYVDNPDSVKGGREIWGLPKEMAEFRWEEIGNNPSVEVRQGDRPLCTFSCNWRSPGLPWSFGMPVFSSLNQQLLVFEGQATFNLHWINADLQIPATSPLAPLGLENSWMCFYCDPLRLITTTPSIQAT